MAYDVAHFTYIREEVDRHLEDTETSKLAHWHAAGIYERRHKLFIGLPAILLSLLLTWMLSADVKTLLGGDGVWGSISKSVPVVLSLLVSVFSGVSTFLNLPELAAKHRSTAENLNVLCRDCKNWDTDFPDVESCERAVQTAQTYRKRLNDINRDAPQIPKWAWLSVKEQRAEGSTSYANDKNAGSSPS